MYGFWPRNFGVVTGTGISSHRALVSGLGAVEPDVSQNDMVAISA